jgi:hypothetical protein
VPGSTWHQCNVLGLQEAVGLLPEYVAALFETHQVHAAADLDVELWPKLGDGVLNKAAYRGGWKPA